MENIEELEYIVEDKILAEVLGRQNFSNKESAVLEIVKNAYDAGATELLMKLKKSNDGMQMIITDNGTGMNEYDIRNSWMHVGRSTRGYINSENSRIYAGSKGIGRFALSRLGKNVEIFTHKNNNSSVKWKTDWERSYLYTNIENKEIGTKIVISGLRDKWSKRALKKLSSYLARVYNDEKMVIKIIMDNEECILRPIWTEPIFGVNCTSNISVQYIAQNQKLIVNIASDEFKKNVQDIVQISTTKKYIEIDVYEHLAAKILSLIEEDELWDTGDKRNVVKNFLEKVGDFSGKLYFALNSVAMGDYEKFQYKYKNISKKYKENIILYRNAFSIDSFEGSKDWLGLARRASHSPAAATHMTGNWRVRANQISGYIEIDKLNNNKIDDLSNRQGIVDNIYFNIFKEIVILSISEFERFRQGIIRKIIKYTAKDKDDGVRNEREEAKTAADKIRKNPKNINKLTEDEINSLINEFDRREEENKSAKKEKEEVEQKARYEAQLLNVLATSQLKVNALGHEIRNNRNIIEATPQDLTEAIGRRLNWDSLKCENVPKYDNIPILLNDLKNNTNKILRLTDVILEEIEKEKFKKDNYYVEKIIDYVIDKWKRQYNWIKFSVTNNISKKVYISYDQLMVIFDNLILNSIQQNESMETLGIEIITSLEGGKLYIKYKDNGKGLEKKYTTNPFMILEPHETTRSNGHGLGMWIVNNTINKLDGEVENIVGEDGFTIDFYIRLGEEE